MVAVWGLAFKPRTDDMREAPAARHHRGAPARAAASVRAYDPKAMAAARRVLGDRVTLLPTQLRGAWKARTRWWWPRSGTSSASRTSPRIKSLMRHPAIFDGRNIYNPQTLRELGFHYEGIGRR